MTEITIDLGKYAKGLRLEIDNCGDAVVTFGEVTLGTILEKLGIADILDEIGEKAVIKHFGIEVAGDEQ